MSDFATKVLAEIEALKRKVATLESANYYPAVARKRDEILESALDRVADEWVGIPILPDLAGHVAAADPHPGYVTTAEGATLISDHEAAANPHPGYLTPAEGDAAYQPLDATLTAFAAVTFAADKGVYATGADAFATFDLSTFGRTLVDDADAAAARTTLQLGDSGVVSGVLDVIGSTRGSILYRGATGWAHLPPGDAGKVLTANGAGADPTWETP